MTASQRLPGSGTTASPSDDMKRCEFQMLKSRTSVTPSALKSPAHQAAVWLNRLLFQILKSDTSTDPSRLASPDRYALPEGKLAAPPFTSHSSRSAVSTIPSPVRSKRLILVPAAISATSASMSVQLSCPSLLKSGLPSTVLSRAEPTLCLTGRVIALADYDHAVGGNTIGPM